MSGLAAPFLIFCRCWKLGQTAEDAAGSWRRFYKDDEVTEPSSQFRRLRDVAFMSTFSVIPRHKASGILYRGAGELWAVKGACEGEPRNRKPREFIANWAYGSAAEYKQEGALARV